MCGVVGGFGPNVQAGVDALVHRGPDAQSLVTVGKVSLGHTRLAIIDLDPRSNQPFVRGDLTMVFNGEIWNYKQAREELMELGHEFSTESDTEVLAAAIQEWDDEAFLRLQGMFAVGWTWDGEILNLARDRFGEVPLHVARQKPFYFASEKKALLAMGCHPKSIDDVLPGCILKVSSTGMINEKWYEPPCDPADATMIEAAPEVYRLIGDGSTERTMSDVPVCTLLSGGIDSAAVAYWLKRTIPDIVAYTAVFDDKSSDLRTARKTAEHLDIELREVPVKMPEAYQLGEVVGCIEMDSKAQVEIGWACMALADVMKADGFKVTFSGEGSDELWASYSFAYHALQKRNWHYYRRDLFLSQARKNFVRCNKIFMSRSIECRLPFLNTGLVEYALSLRRDAVQADGGRKPKEVMRMAFEDVLDESVLNRPKVAFQDGLGLKKAIEESLPSPVRFYRTEYVNQFG